MYELVELQKLATLLGFKEYRPELFDYVGDDQNALIRSLIFTKKVMHHESFPPDDKNKRGAQLDDFMKEHISLIVSERDKFPIFFESPPESSHHRPKSN